MSSRRDVLRMLVAAGLGGLGCGRGATSDDPRRLVLKHQPFWGDAAPFRAHLAAFERAHPGITVATEPLPNASDVAHQFFLTALEGGATDFDLFVADVVWVPELARAGWIADLSSAFPEVVLERDFLPGPAQAARFAGRTYAVPFYVDVGLLYYRRDHVAEPPATYDALVDAALRAKRDLGAGYLWQGRQYEGLVCNAYEAIWGHGGATMQGDRVLLDAPAAIAAMATMRSLLATGVSPASVTSAAEEECRRVFQEGRAAFMRNWPYAWAEAQREGSAVRDLVGVAPLPTISGEPGPGALGGYLLALNAHSPPQKREAALALLAHLTSPEAARMLALHYARNPARRATYEDPELQRAAPFMASLLPMVEGARPRPITPYYPMIADGLQGELSAIVAGIRSPEEGLARAQTFVDRVMGTRA